MLNPKSWNFPGNRFAGILLAGVLLVSGCAPSGPKALLKGEKLIREGKFEQAIAPLKIAADLLPQNAQVWNHLGMAYHGLHQRDNAAAAYRQALNLDRNLAAARFNLGSLLLESGDASLAASELTTFCMLQPNSAEGWVKLGTAQLATRQSLPAAHSFTNALQLQPVNPEAWNGIGMLQMEKKLPREAMTCFMRAQQQQTNFAPAVLNQAIVFQKDLRQPSLALQKYKEYVQIQPPAANREAVQAVIAQLELDLAPVPNPVISNLIAKLSATNAVPTNVPVSVVSAKTNETRPWLIATNRSKKTTNAIPAASASTVISNLAKAIQNETPVSIATNPPVLTAAAPAVTPRDVPAVPKAEPEKLKPVTPKIEPKPEVTLPPKTNTVVEKKEPAAVEKKETPAPAKDTNIVAAPKPAVKNELVTVVHEIPVPPAS